MGHPPAWIRDAFHKPQTATNHPFLFDVVAGLLVLEGMPLLVAALRFEVIAVVAQALVVKVTGPTYLHLSHVVSRNTTRFPAQAQYIHCLIARLSQAVSTILGYGRCSTPIIARMPSCEQSLSRATP